MRKLLLAATIFAAACGGGNKSNNSTGTIDQFCPSLVNALVSKYASCLNAPSDAMQSLLGASSVCTDISKAVKANRVKYDSSQASACLSAVNGASCNALNSIMSDPNSACSKAVQGQVAQNGACYQSVDCAGGASCSASDTSCPGTCGPPAAQVGQACGSNPCVQGSSCVQGATGASTCVADVAQGGNCGATGQGDCQSGLYCSGGTCQPLQTSGSCTTGSGNQCAFGYNCVGPAGGSGTCQQAKAVGSSCTAGNRECNVLSYCSSNNTCTEFPKTGGTCGLMGGNEIAGCLDSYCANLSAPSYQGTCAAYKNVGDTCNPNSYGGNECGDGYCDSSTSKCVAGCHEA